MLKHLRGWIGLEKDDEIDRNVRNLSWPCRRAGGLVGDLPANTRVCALQSNPGGATRSNDPDEAQEEARYEFAMKHTAYSDQTYWREAYRAEADENYRIRSALGIDQTEPDEILTVRQVKNAFRKEYDRGLEDGKRRFARRLAEDLEIRGDHELAKRVLRLAGILVISEANSDKITE